MERLIEAYLASLVEDAARALAGQYNQSFPEPVCQAALSRLQTGVAGEDQMVEAAALLTGLEPHAVFRGLLRQAQVLARVMCAEGYKHPKSRAA